MILLINSTLALAQVESPVKERIANPAALNCLKLGGSLEKIVSPEGEGFNCAIEQWTLFYAMNDRGLVHPSEQIMEEGGRIGLPNPAAINCIHIGGILRYEQQAQASTGFCLVEEWKLFSVINIIDEKN